MADPNGCNTTAAAAVLACQQHVKLDNQRVIVLGGTGPVGQRIAQVICGLNLGGEVVVCSRQLDKAQTVVDGVKESCEHSDLETELRAAAVASAEDALELTANADVVFSAGAAGVALLDLNAVPPAGIAGISPTDAGTGTDGKVCYGAIGVGELKMRIHKRAIRSLFESNDRVLDTQAIYEIGLDLLAE